MLRPGDPERWKTEIHPGLKGEEQEILQLAQKHFPGGGFTAHDLVRVGYSKTSTSAVRWINKMTNNGILFYEMAGPRKLWYVSDYGLWRVSNG